MKTTKHKSMRTRKVMVFLLLLSAIVVFSNPVQPGITGSKYSRGSAAFDEGSRILNIGMGFGARGYYGYGRGYGYIYRGTPAFSISYEQPLAKKAGPGYLAIGGYFGFQYTSSRYDNYYFKNEKYYYKHSWNHLILAGRAVYHADALIWENAEVYFGLMAGLRFQTYRYSTNNPDPDAYQYELSQSSIYPVYSLFAGGRWYLNEKIALFGELGYGISYLTLGLSLKL